MIFVALAEAAEKRELILVQDGLCRWHKRRDGVVVIREIIVLPFRRRTGVAKRMLQDVRDRNPGSLMRATCPVEYESNGFWRHMGFTLKHSSGTLNTWEFQT